jgi:hypothetical protein
MTAHGLMVLTGAKRHCIGARPGSAYGGFAAGIFELGGSGSAGGTSGDGK